jgi:hypothetical protein
MKADVDHAATDNCHGHERRVDLSKSEGDEVFQTEDLPYV